MPDEASLAGREPVRYTVAPPLARDALSGVSPGLREQHFLLAILINCMIKSKELNKLYLILTWHY